MKKFLLTVFLLSSILGSGQNLVMNSSLENYITCPGFGQFSSTYINNWSKPSIGSTDYYNTNCTGIQPVNQVPHSGNAYFGIIAFNYSGEYREYATGQLSAPLIAGVPYIVTFYASLNDGYIQAVNELGAYLSVTPPGPFGNALHIAVTPQVENTSGVLGSDTSWMFVSGSFIASGGEQYITIGNFHDDASTTVTQVGSVGSYGAYYFIDDVSVKSQEPNGIGELNNSPAYIYPNPVANTLNIEVKKSARVQITLYDVLMRRVMEETFSRKISLETAMLEQGAYVYILKQDNKIIKQGRIIKQ
jgi:OmpA-OmpF porin, OOP family